MKRIAISHLSKISTKDTNLNTTKSLINGITNRRNNMLIASTLIQTTVNIIHQDLATIFHRGH